MICWPGQQGDPAPFEERLWREARRLCPEGVPGALLLLRPADDGMSAPDALATLAAALRPALRRSDSVLVDAGYAVGVILVGARLEGAHIAARRLLLGLMSSGGEVPSATATGRFLALTVGYSMFASRRPLDRWDVGGALRSAARPRAVVVIPYPRVPHAEDEQRSANAEMTGAPPAYAPRPRVIRRGGRRESERAPVMLDRSARRLAVGAALPPLSDEDDDGMPMVRVVRFASAPDGERDRLRLRALAMGVPFLHLPAVLPEECRAALDADLARELRAVPIGRTETALTVALDSRWNARVLFRLRAATGLEIFPVLTLPEELDHALAQMSC